MDNKEFDDIIKKKLESLSSDGAGGNWDTFRQRWLESDQADDDPQSDSQIDDHVDPVTPESDLAFEKTNAAFDKKLKENLSSLRMPFNSAHWVILKAQLEAEALFKKRLFVAKSVEVLMLLLIVIGILNIVPIKNEVYQIPMYNASMTASIAVDKRTADKYAADQITNYIKANQDPIVNAINTAIMGKNHTNTLASTKVSNAVQHTLEEEKKFTGRFGEIKTDVLPFLSSLKEKNSHVEGHKNNRKSPRDRKESASVLDHTIRPVSNSVKALSIPPIAALIKPLAENKNTYLGLAIGPKINLINSPFDPIYKVDPYNTLNTNFNIGARFEKEIGPVTAYAGLGYHKTSYEPLPVSELYEDIFNAYNQTSLENISFSTIDIPLGIKYDVIKRDKFAVYASAGVSLNIIGDAQYDVLDAPLGRNQPALPPSVKPDRNPEISTEAKLSEKEFSRGIFHGGSLSDNLYATASVGIGLSRRITDISSIYVEPTYSHFISPNGIGPNEDKLHSVAVSIGMRFRLD